MAIAKPFIEQITLPAKFILLDGDVMAVESVQTVAVVPKNTAFQFVRHEDGYAIYHEISVASSLER